MVDEKAVGQRASRRQPHEAIEFTSGIEAAQHGKRRLLHCVRFIKKRLAMWRERVAVRTSFE